MGQDDQDWKGQDAGEIATARIFETLKSQDIRNERRILWYELAIIPIIAMLAAVYIVASLISIGIISMPDL